MQKSAAPAIAPGISGNIFLVGLMGAGKTSVGRLLARRLGKQFIDSDHQIESRTGVRIPVIFEIEGESGFRQRESAAIDELTRGSNLVLATGEGSFSTLTTGPPCVHAGRLYICGPQSMNCGTGLARTETDPCSRLPTHGRSWRSCLQYAIRSTGKLPTLSWTPAAKVFGRSFFNWNRRWFD